ncbi:MAG: hypothetical protein WAO76_15395 [Georgfuchsia sp.]
MRRHSSPHTPGHSRQHGYALLIMLILLTMGILFGVVSQVSMVGLKWSRMQGTQTAIVQAKEALIGYALRYREDQTAQDHPDRVYGYLPLPDLGTARNNNISCTQEGCDAANFSGNALNTTVIGRLPWRTLGLDSLRDSSGECLWYIVSGSHQRIQQSEPMNWDTLGQLDIVVANGSSALVSALTSAHDRPVAVIFSPGPPLPGQDRSTSTTDDVSQCGGNYDAKNYLDPATATALGGIANYLSGTNSASGDTSDPDIPKALSIQGTVFNNGSAYVPNSCDGNNCVQVANDIGLALTGNELFGAIRKSSNFRTDINTMLDRMSSCLRDKFAAGVPFTPVAISGLSPADKSAGHVPDDTCYDDNQNPLGYYSHYEDIFFVAKPNSGYFTVNADSSCAAVLLFANQRSTSQLRITTAQKSAPSNYLEDVNLSSFTGTGADFVGDALFGRVLPQAVNQDIVRCIPASASITTIDSPELRSDQQLTAYDAATRTLTLGKANVSTGHYGSPPASALFGCAWLSDTQVLGNGLRTYFNFQFMKVGTSVGNNGFVFALADAAKNSLDACGAAGNHLGYSGDNGSTPKIIAPKIGIEFDQSRNSGFSENTDPTRSGRNDPCGTSGCGGTVGYNSHAAIVYWGHDAANTTDGVTTNYVDYDDNVHGFPTSDSLPGATRPPPQNPPYPSSGIAFKDLRGQTSLSGDSYLYYVRTEITPTRHANSAAAELSYTSVKTEVWIENSNTNQIAAIKNTTRPMAQLYPGYAATLADTATIYDVAMGSCDADNACPTGQACGTDNICYRPALQTVQIGFTGSQRTTDQEVNISDYITTGIQ